MSAGPEEAAGESDEALVRACLQGEPRAFERLVELHRRVVFSAIRTVLERGGARDDAELADEAFVRVFATVASDSMRVLRSFRGRARLGTFLVVIARRTTLRLIGERRPAGARPLPGDDGAGGTEPSDPAPGPPERAEREEARAIVREAVATLSHRDALAIRLFYEQELAHREIGTVLGVPVTHVGQILARAREKLRAKLDGAGLGGGLSS